MNIRDFKEGDIITRNAPCVYAHNGIADGSYTGDRIVFIGFDEESKIIFLKMEDDKEAYSISCAQDAWDEGWCRYPEALLEKAKKLFKKL